MAVWCVREVGRLDDGWILAPERYDPRRSSLGDALGRRQVPLRSLVHVHKRVVAPATAERAGERFVVLDTTHAREGIVIGAGEPVAGTQLGSAKKAARAGHVIVSRLRPYLRQIAFVDDEVPWLDRGTSLLCSTEFFVLQGYDDESIAFLVPFLLSAPVQAILAASQEGGHHPRFGEQALLDLPVPKDLVDRRHEESASVSEAIRQYRRCERALADMILSAGKCLEAAAIPG